MGEVEAATALDWMAVIELVGPMAGSVLSTLILVVPILWGLLRFIARAQGNDIKTARVLERLCVTMSGLPNLTAAAVADVLSHDRRDTLDSDTHLEYRAAAEAAEVDAAQNLSDPVESEKRIAEIRRRYAG